MSDKTDIWMPLYIGDYLAATQHLSTEQSGGYLHLLMHEWKEGPLPLTSEQLRRITRLDREPWEEAWPLLKPFFERVEQGYVQKRLEVERSRALEQKERRSNHGRAGATARWGQVSANALPEHCPGIANVMPEEWPSPSPSQKQQKHEPSALSLVIHLQEQPDGRRERFTDEDVESIWNCWPNKGGKKAGLKAIREALRHLKAQGSEDPALELQKRVQTWLAWHARQANQGFVPAIGFAQGWFGNKQQRYLDPAAQPPAPALLKLPDGRLVTEDETAAEGWKVMRGDV